MGSGLLDFDAVAAKMAPADFGRAVSLQLTSGETVCLQPWTYRRHLDGLQQCVTAQDGELALDAAAFAARVLSHAGVAPPLHAALTPLALWWAAGGNAASAGAQPDALGWLNLGQTKVQLRPWLEQQRMAALQACVSEDEGASRFDAAAYLDAMTRASVQQFAPGGSFDALDSLDSYATNRLLAAVVACNVAAPVAEKTPAGREAALRTLRLCQALGWTPSQVLATPAVEIDRLLALLDASQAPLQPQRQWQAQAAAAPKRRSMADLPDAVVIMIDDDDDNEAAGEAGDAV